MSTHGATGETSPGITPGARFVNAARRPAVPRPGLGLDRAPEVKTLRRKLAELAAHGAGAQLQAALGAHHAQARQDATCFLYLDGHVRV